jgi:hypothetical protein
MLGLPSADTEAGENENVTGNVFVPHLQPLWIELHRYCNEMQLEDAALPSGSKTS